jgi:hypothetical protein
MIIENKILHIEYERANYPNNKRQTFVDKRWKNNN